MTKRRRLFFCVTPLNLLIAQAIRLLEPGRDTLVYVPSVRGPKYQFYFDRFEWDRKIWAATNPGWFPDIAYESLKCLRVLRALDECQFDQLIFGNIGSLTFAFIAKRYGDAPITTFDDGTLHADAETHANWLRQEPLSHRLFRRVTGACTNASVLSRVERHYTIFPAELYALNVPEVVEIPLFANLPTPSPQSRPVKVLLGTPETELVLGIDEVEYESLVKKLDPDIYLPHPREQRPAYLRLQREHKQQLKKAAEVLAAEDFVAELVKLGYNPSIEGFGSTALLNLARRFATKTYYGAARPPQPIFAKLGVSIEPLEHHLN